MSKPHRYVRRSQETMDVDQFKRAQREVLEYSLGAAWANACEIPLVEQFAFHPTRKWRFDFAIPDIKLAIEVQGGTYIRGGHSRGAGQGKDYEKHNAATELGWRVLFADTKMLGKNEIGRTVEVFINVARKMIGAKDGN